MGRRPGADWPLTSPLALSAETVGGNEDPLQAHAMNIDAVRKLGDVATNAEIMIYKRAYASGIPLMTYDRLRFSDAQRIRPLEVNGDSIRGHC